MGDSGSQVIFSRARRGVALPKRRGVIAARACSEVNAEQLLSCFDARARDGSLRARARLGATGLRSASVMADYELSRRGLDGEMLVGAERS
jgi:hypothetical protein